MPKDKVILTDFDEDTGQSGPVSPISGQGIDERLAKTFQAIKTYPGGGRQSGDLHGEHPLENLDRNVSKLCGLKAHANVIAVDTGLHAGRSGVKIQRRRRLPGAAPQPRQRRPIQTLLGQNGRQTS